MAKGIETSLRHPAHPVKHRYMQLIRQSWQTEDSLQRAVHKLWQIANQYNLNFSTNKTKVKACIGANTLLKKM
jgi:hypothetical protein